MMNAKKIIQRLHLSKHVEGGYYQRTYQSDVQIHLPYGNRPINTAIYYLLESDDFSAWHRLKGDEIFHYYAGSDLIIHQIDRQGVFSSTCVGSILTNDATRSQFMISAGNWFAAEVALPNSFTLVGCTVSPGFTYEDLEIADRNELLAQYPQYAVMIRKFTR